MIIDAIHSLKDQRAALEAAPEERANVYQAQVIEPLRPFWESMLRYMPPAPDGQQPDPARIMGLYGPDANPEEGLAALAWLERSGSWEACLEALRRAEAALRPADHGIAVDRVRFSLALANPATVGAMGGYTGATGGPRQAIVLVWPDAHNIAKLPAAAAHEFHHLVRLSYEPWTLATTVGQYIVVEGLAEALAAELYGEELLGPWTAALTEAQIEEVRPRYRAAIEVSGFNEIRGYMFGDQNAEQFGYKKQGIPQYAGYTMGYRVVREYLKRTGMKASAATYVPWQEIVKESRYL